MTDFPVRENDGSRNLDFTGVNVTGLVVGGNLISLNGDNTPAQVIQGFGVGVKDNGGGLHTLSTQMLGDFGIHITDLGGGKYQFNEWSNFDNSALTVTIPVDVETVAISLTIPVPGQWLYIANVKGAIPPGTDIVSRVRILSGVAMVAESCHNVSSLGILSEDAHSCMSYMNNNAGGEVIALEVTQHSGAPIAYDCVLTIYRIGL